MAMEDYTPKPDWKALEKGFAIHQNRFTKYWFCNSVESNEDGDYQFCFKNMDYQAKQLCGLLNGLLIEYHALKEKFEKLQSSDDGKQFRFYPNSFIDKNDLTPITDQDNIAYSYNGIVNTLNSLVNEKEYWKQRYINEVSDELPEQKPKLARCVLEPILPEINIENNEIDVSKKAEESVKKAFQGLNKIRDDDYV